MGKIGKVLIISKMTELEFDENKYGAAVDEYHRLMKVDVSRLEENHEYHYSCLDRIVGAFRRYGVSPGIIKKQNLGRSDFKERWDLIVPTGGDGTFMDAARYVRDETLFFGIKSSPRSVGGHYDANFSNAEAQIRKVMEGDFSVELRTRIEGGVHNEIPVTDLALNDLYVGDRYIVGYSRLEVRLGGEAFEVGGNGILFSTYHGRTGWYDNIPIPERNPQLTAAAGEFLAQRGIRQGIRLASSQCDFTPGEAGDIKYKLLMRDAKKESARPDWGIIRPGETCTIVSRVPSNGCVSFDGNKTARPRHRMYDLHDGSAVTVRVSDRPLHVVKV
ncbi:MAG: NAD(+)/NADH kinase [Candidatus Methylomirabilia bacterium]